MKKLFTIFFLILASTCFSQAVKISELPAVSGTNLDSALVPVVENGTTKKARGYMFGSTQDIDSLTKSVSGCRVIYTTWKNGTGTNIDTAYRRDGIVTGGLILNRLNDSTFRISAAQYLIGCSNYNSPLDTITLAGSTGSALSRFYTIGFDNTNNVFFSAGTPSASPQIPQVDEATQIGKYTVFFPAGSDSAITNIYTTVNYSGVDSGAIYSFTQLDSFNILACRRNGICDTFRSIYTAGGIGIDSIRRIGINVSVRKYGIWINQYTDSVGAGGGSASQPLDLTLRNGNTTRQQYIVDDSSSVSTGSLNFWQLLPSNFRTNYGTRGTAMGFKKGYVRANGVNASGRPNVVIDWLSYNGGFNTPDSANEATYRMGFETHFETGGRNLFEVHFGEMKCRGCSASRRIMSWYIDKDNSYTNVNMQIDQMTMLQGATDTSFFSASPLGASFGWNVNSNLGISNTRVPTRTWSIALLDNGASYNIGGGATPSVSYHTFNSPIHVSPSATIGTSSLTTIQAGVSVANNSGVNITQTGLSASNFKGYTANDINTSGQFDLLYGRNLGTGTIRAHLQTNTNGTASFVWSDQSTGLGWLASFRGGTSERSWHLNSSSYDSAFSVRGTDGKVKIRNSLNVGDGTYPVTSAALQVTSTTQGFLLPRMTKAQRDLIASPVAGLSVYQTDNTPGIRVYNGTNWMRYTETTD